MQFRQVHLQPILRCSELIVLSGLLTATIQAETRTAYVLDVRGQWNVENSFSTLQKGQIVEQGSRFRHVGSSEQDFIVLAGPWIMPKRFSCARPEHCDGMLAVPANEGPNRGAEIYSAVMQLWHSQKSWDEGFSRGSELNDAVVQLKDGKLFVARSFIDLPKDPYRLRVRRIEGTSEGPRFTDITDSPLYDWDPEHPAPLVIEGIRPGLYEIGIMRPNPGGQYEFSGVSGWALVCESNFAACKSWFQKASDLTNSWGDTVRPGVHRNFLRAYLQTLSEQAR